MPISELKGARRRVRKADEAQILRILASIREFGVCRPILTNGEHRIIDGHLVVEAAGRAGLHSVACIVIDHLDEAQQRLLTLSINRIQERGAWDFSALQLEAQELVLLDQPIEISGFSAPEIDQILIGDEEEAPGVGPLEPTPGAVPVSRVGDLWRLGDHRILCGDSTDPRSFERVFMGSPTRLVLTDVPFNVPIARHVTSGPHREFVQASGDMTVEEFTHFNLAWMHGAKHWLSDGGLLATFIDWQSVELILRLGSELELSLLNLIVWAKTNAGMGSLWRSQHELLPVFKVGSFPHVNNVNLGRHGRHRSNVWTYPGASSMGSDARSESPRRRSWRRPCRRKLSRWGSVGRAICYAPLN